MKPVAKLIHRTYASYLPTAFPAHYYGMPNGKIFLIFSRFYEAAIGKTVVEFVFAEHKEFSYDYENDAVIATSNNKRQTPVFAENLDYPRAKYNVFNINRDLKSYGEALVLINKQAKKMTQIA